ncbi:MAG TPA: hypothetical protein VKZ53_06450 [Candidatus Angelobacter sp.]|nr:hypothetical protein [Candidatus Angelobacter sp.]
MLRALKEFKIGQPQVFAGLLLSAFLLQCLWASSTRTFSELEYQYIASGHRLAADRQGSGRQAPGNQTSGEQGLGEQNTVTSPLTGVVANLPLRLLAVLRRWMAAPATSTTLGTGAAAASMPQAFAIPPTWLVRLPFITFGLWLGAALWWVARRLFGDSGGYVALALYCFSPAMVMVSSIVGPEIVLAWSGFGMIYTAIGVAHTVYASPRKWAPRILLLGVSIGICISTALWAFSFVLLSAIFMMYLAPQRRRGAVLLVLSTSIAIGLAILGFFAWMTGSFGAGHGRLVAPHFTWALLRNLSFPFADSYALPMILVPALTIYGSWPRARYFGNTAPLVASFASVLLFTLVPAIYLWYATLGLSFVFLFIGGIAADVLETRFRPVAAWLLAAAVTLKAIFCLILMHRWGHQNTV